MNMMWKCAAIAASGFVAPAVLGGSPVYFSGLGDLPGGFFNSSPKGISPDGTAVVGRSTISTQGANGAFLWTRGGGLQQLPPIAGASAVANAVSNGGQTVVGISNSRAFRWTTSGGTEDLGTVRPDNSGFSNAHGVTADGSIVTGTTQTADGTDQFDGFLWTESTGMQTIEFFDGADISNDGSVAVGVESGGGFRSVIWTQDTGVQEMGFLPGGTNSNPTRISGDGKIVVGSGDYLPSGRGIALSGAFRWSAETGMELLPGLPGAGSAPRAEGVNGDGSIIVGATGSGANSTAFIWDAVNGTRDLNLVAAEWGIDLGQWRLIEATDISDDGLSLTGVGINPNGDFEAWYISIPSPGTVAAILPLLGISLRRRRDA